MNIGTSHYPHSGMPLWLVGFCKAEQCWCKGYFNRRLRKCEIPLPSMLSKNAQPRPTLRDHLPIGQKENSIRGVSMAVRPCIAVCSKFAARTAALHVTLQLLRWATAGKERPSKCIDTIQASMLQEYKSRMLHV